MWRMKASSHPRSCRQQGVRQGQGPGPFLRVLPPRRVDVAHEGIQPPPVLQAAGCQAGAVARTMQGHVARTMQGSSRRNSEH